MVPKPNTVTHDACLCILKDLRLQRESREIWQANPSVYFPVILCRNRLWPATSSKRQWLCSNVGENWRLFYSWSDGWCSVRRPKISFSPLTKERPVFLLYSWLNFSCHASNSAIFSDSLSARCDMANNSRMNCPVILLFWYMNARGANPSRAYTNCRAFQRTNTEWCQVYAPN